MEEAHKIIKKNILKNINYVSHKMKVENDNLILDTTTEVHGFLLDTIFIKDSSGFKNIIN